MAKYGNVKTVIDGITFDSKAEAKRYEYLSLIQRAGHIRNLRTQVEFELIPKLVNENGKTERAVKYKADFVYSYEGTIGFVVEDVKGFKTKDYIIKRKLMLQKHGVTIREVK